MSDEPMLSEPIAVTFTVIEALEALGVPYLIGGSLASAVHGTVRATMDVDLVADLQMQHAEPLAKALQNEFYVDVETVRDAILRRDSFNAIHLETMFKVDIFVLKSRAFDQEQFKRRTEQILAADPERTAFVATAEDTILAKLEWYAKGGEVSDRQWQDVLGIIEVQGDALDLAYLEEWAAELGLAELLERALEEAG